MVQPKGGYHPRPMKSDAERGPFGAWLVRQRKARPGSGRDGSMTADEVRRAVQRAAGLGFSPSVYAELEAGTRWPSSDQRSALEAWAGEAAPRQTGVDSSDVIAAIDRLTATVGLLMEVPALRAELADLRGAVVELTVEVERLKIGNRAYAVRHDQDIADG